MKILHAIAGPGAGGAEVYVKDLLKSFTARGVECHVAFWGTASDFGRSSDFEAQFLADLKRSGIHYFFIGYASRKFPWLGAWRIMKYVKFNRIDIYHAHFLNAILYGILLRIHRIYTHHNIEMRGRRWQYFIFNFFVDAYVGISKKCAEKLHEITHRKVDLIYNAVDIDKINTAEKKRNYYCEKLKLIAVGRVTDQKNFFHLVDVICDVSKKHSNEIEVYIVGEGDSLYESRLIEYIKMNELSDTIFHLGNRSDVYDLFKICHVFLMSSDWEGLPISLLEATASGLPCIVTDVGGCREVIDLCGNGIVVPPRNILLFSQALERLINHRYLLQEYEQSALRHSHLLSIENSVNLHSELYGRL